MKLHFLILLSVGLYSCNNSQTLDKPVAANKKPTAKFTIDKTTGTAPLTVLVDASSSSDPEGSSLEYLWDWGDGSAVGTNKISSHVYQAEKTYTLNLTVKDSDGLIGTMVKSVIVSKLIIPTESLESSNVYEGQWYYKITSVSNPNVYSEGDMFFGPTTKEASGNASTTGTRYYCLGNGVFPNCVITSSTQKVTLEYKNSKIRIYFKGNNGTEFEGFDTDGKIDSYPNRKYIIQGIGEDISFGTRPTYTLYLERKIGPYPDL